VTILENLKRFIFRATSKTEGLAESVKPLTLQQKLENQKERMFDAKKEMKTRFFQNYVIIVDPPMKDLPALTPAVLWFVWEWSKYSLLRVRLWLGLRL